MLTFVDINRITGLGGDGELPTHITELHHDRMIPVGRFQVYYAHICTILIALEATLV